MLSARDAASFTWGFLEIQESFFDHLHLCMFRPEEKAQQAQIETQD